MKSYRVFVNYDVHCKADGYIDVEANSKEEASKLAESLEGCEIENVNLEEYEVMSISTERVVSR